MTRPKQDTIDGLRRFIKATALLLAPDYPVPSNSAAFTLELLRRTNETQRLLLNVIAPPEPDYEPEGIPEPGDTVVITAPDGSTRFGHVTNVNPQDEAPGFFTVDGTYEDDQEDGNFTDVPHRLMPRADMPTWHGDGAGSIPLSDDNPWRNMDVDSLVQGGNQLPVPGHSAAQQATIRAEGWHAGRLSMVAELGDALAVVKKDQLVTCSHCDDYDIPASPDAMTEAQRIYKRTEADVKAEQQRHRPKPRPQTG